MSLPTNTAPQSWEALRRKTRNLESALDARLTSYSQLASKIARSSDSTDHTALNMDGGGAGERAEHEEQETEIEDLLNQLSVSVDKLTATLDDPAGPPSTSQLHAVQRHREVLQDFTRDFRRSKTNVRHAIDRRDLLGTVRGDIE